MRLFIGVPVGMALATRLETERDQWLQQYGVLGVQYVPPQNYHMTLFFLGSKVSHAQMIAVSERLSETFDEGLSAFELNVHKIGRFPDEQGVYLAALLDYPIMLQGLMDELYRALKPLGFEKPQRRFYPHITLARLTHNSTGASTCILEPSDILSLSVNHFHLYQSQSATAANRYSIVATQSLECF